MTVEAWLDTRPCGPWRGYGDSLLAWLRLYGLVMWLTFWGLRCGNPSQPVRFPGHTVPREGTSKLEFGSMVLAEREAFDADEQPTGVIFSRSVSE
jgi:hypothetical protein